MNRKYDYNEVARVYLQAHQAGQRPRRAVMDAFDIGPDTAAQLVRRVRKDGLIPGGWLHRCSGRCPVCCGGRRSQPPTSLAMLYRDLVRMKSESDAVAGS